MLEEAGVIATEQKRDMLARAERERALLMRERFGSAGRPASGEHGVHPAEVIARMKVPVLGDPSNQIGERLVMHMLAQKTGVPFVDLDPLKLDAKLAPQVLSRPFARRHGALVIAADDKSVTLAVGDPFDHRLTDDVVTLVRRAPKLVLAQPSEIQRLITDFYGFRGAVAEAAKQVGVSVDIGNLERYVRLKRVEEIEATDSHVVNAVEYLMHYALDQRASDVHIEPRREHSVVRMRIDGVLHEVHSLPKAVHNAVVSRIKTLSRLDIAEKRRPQDGRLKTARADREVEMRVSTLATAFGEKLVLRVQDPENLVRDLGELGLFEDQLVRANEFFDRPNGLILVTGPTGSGKTCTLYAALRQLARPHVNVVTIEDPIEVIVDLFNQVAVHAKIGLGFAEALRHVLRQDPDVIMIGEMRDAETADIALQAALTGHLVLGTLHTNDAATAVTRLLELGVDPFVLSSTLVGVVAQRLVRLVCPNCRVDTFLTADQMGMIGLDPIALEAQGESPSLMVAHGEGCVKCRSTGLLQRTGVFEVLEVDDKIRKLIVNKTSSKDIAKQARHDGMLTLRDCAIRKLARGTTSFEEVLRVTSEG